MSDLDRLTAEYIQKQIERISAVIAKLLSREQSVAAGRVVPDDNDVTIGSGRCIHAAVLFLDISSFSSRPAATQSEQEALLRLLTIFFTEIIRVVEEYGGTVEKNTGDGLMAYFVSTPERSAEKAAVAAALTICHVGRNAIATAFQLLGATPFQFRICIDCGPVTIARVGAPQRFGSLVAIGTAANIACKMLALANAGDVLIGAAVLAGLPLDWMQRFTRLRAAESGWEYRATGAPYPVYEYIGRWKDP